MVTNIIRLAKKNAHCRNLIDSSIRTRKCTGNVENVRIVQILHGTPPPETKDADGHAARSYILRSWYYWSYVRSEPCDRLQLFVAEIQGT